MTSPCASLDALSVFVSVGITVFGTFETGAGVGSLADSSPFSAASAAFAFTSSFFARILSIRPITCSFTVSPVPFLLITISALFAFAIFSAAS